jgi:hypothetical protein
LASYLLGHVTYQLGRFVDRALPSWGRRTPDGRQRFISRVRGPKARLLAEADPLFLLAAVRLRAEEIAVEISRFQAGALMLRTAAPAFILAFLVLLVELTVGSNRPFAGFCAVLFLLTSLAALRDGREQADWVLSTILQTVFCTSEMDEHKSVIASLAEQAKLDIEGTRANSIAGLGESCR